MFGDTYAMPLRTYPWLSGSGAGWRRVVSSRISDLVKEETGSHEAVTRLVLGLYGMRRKQETFQKQQARGAYMSR
jgi:hypothetical protein